MGSGNPGSSLHYASFGATAPLWSGLVLIVEQYA
jgi:hypothetical protein